MKTIATFNYRNNFLWLYPNQLASLWWFCHFLNLANMKSQLIYTFPFPISGFFIVVVVVCRDCTQFVANWRTTFLGHSLWVRFELILKLGCAWSWSLSLGCGLGCGLGCVVMPFWHLITIWLLWAKWMCPQRAPRLCCLFPHDYSQFHCCPPPSLLFAVLLL